MWLRLKDNIFNRWSRGTLAVRIFFGGEGCLQVHQDGDQAVLEGWSSHGRSPYTHNSVRIPSTPTELAVSLWWKTGWRDPYEENNGYEGLDAFYLYAPRSGYSLVFPSLEENISLAAGSIRYNVNVKTPYGKIMPFPLLTSPIMAAEECNVDVDMLYRQTLKRYTEEPVDILRSTLAC